MHHRAGIEAFIHLHDANPGFTVAGFDGALNGRRPTPAGKQGSMDVPAAVFRALQDFCGQDQSISYYDHQVCLQVRNQVPGRCIPERGWLVHGDSSRDGKLFDGAGLHLPATAGGAVRLGQDRDGRKSLRNQSLQGRH